MATDTELREPARGATACAGPARTALAWSLGLAISLLGSWFAVRAAVSAAQAKATALNDAGISVIPAGSVLANLTAPELVFGGALMLTACVGGLGCLIGHFTSDLVPARFRTPAVLALVGVFAVASALGAQAAIVLLPALSVFVLRGASRSPWGVRTACWLTALALVVPAALTIERQDFYHLRDLLGGSSAGQWIVNQYYRHALHAAEAVKSPTQQLYATYHWPGGMNEPGWFTCEAQQRRLLPLRQPELADLRLRHGAGNVPQLAGTPLGTDNIAFVLERALEASDRNRAMRWSARAGLVALPLAFGLLVTTSLLAPLLRRFPVGIMPLAGLAIGMAIVVAWAKPGNSVPGAEHPAARAALAADASTPLATVRALATHDPHITVRAAALRALVTRATPPSAMRGHIRDAGTWYEQWHGYHALLARGWHPLPRDCLTKAATLP